MILCDSSACAGAKEMVLVEVYRAVCHACAVCAMQKKNNFLHDGIMHAAHSLMLLRRDRGGFGSAPRDV